MTNSVVPKFPSIEGRKHIIVRRAGIASCLYAMVRVVVVSLIASLNFLALSYAVFVSNLDVACLRCICTASTGCDESYDCSPQGFCGPFFISRKYWEEGGRLLKDARYQGSSDEVAHEACAKDMACAGRVVAEYMAKNARDCNNDGVTDCDDFARVHFYGGPRCGNSMEKTSYYDRFLTCRPPKPSEDLSLLHS